jgi:hypothetical protein
MPLFGKWRRKDIYQNTEDRTPATLTNYFLNVCCLISFSSRRFNFRFIASSSNEQG